MKSNTCKIFELSVKTSDGEFAARYSERGLVAIRFPGELHRPANHGSDVPARIEEWHGATSVALALVLEAKQPGPLPPMDLSSGTAFQQRVWSALREIGCGQTRSYSEVAHMIGQPNALRAVGGACGANPIPVLIPCHRVLAAHHRLGGFSAGRGWKLRLLAREGITFPKQGFFFESDAAIHCVIATEGIRTRQAPVRV
jgi:O-6-methylguanine DNA methyltransferase